MKVWINSIDLKIHFNARFQCRNLTCKTKETVPFWWFRLKKVLKQTEKKLESTALINIRMHFLFHVQGQPESHVYIQQNKVTL